MIGVDIKLVQLESAECKKEKYLEIKRKRQTTNFDNTVVLTDSSIISGDYYAVNHQL